jgi:hypothetical protein
VRRVGSGGVAARESDQNVDRGGGSEGSFDVLVIQRPKRRSRCRLDERIDVLVVEAANVEMQPDRAVGSTFPP